MRKSTWEQFTGIRVQNGWRCFSGSSAPHDSLIVVEEELSQHGCGSQLGRWVLSRDRLLPDLQESFGRSDVLLKVGHLFLKQAPQDGYLFLGGPAAGH
jgi:hypothetical protein